MGKMGVALTVHGLLIKGEWGAKGWGLEIWLCKGTLHRKVRYLEVSIVS